MIVFDSTNYKGKPTNLGNSFPFACCNGWWIVQNVDASGTPTPNLSVDGSQAISESGTRYLAHWYAKQNNSKLLLIDIEGGLLNPENVTNIINWIKSENPSIRIGFFDLPQAIGNYKTYDPLLIQRQTHDLYAVCLDKMDFMCPNLYIGNETISDFLIRARWIVSECNSISPGKAVIPFVSPRYIDYVDWPSPIINGGFMPPSLLSSYLDAIKKSGADGFVVWDSSTDDWKSKGVSDAYKVIKKYL